MFSKLTRLFHLTDSSKHSQLDHGQHVDASTASNAEEPDLPSCPASVAMTEGNAFCEPDIVSDPDDEPCDIYSCGQDDNEEHSETIEMERTTVCQGEGITVGSVVGSLQEAKNDVLSSLCAL